MLLPPPCSLSFLSPNATRAPLTRCVCEQENYYAARGGHSSNNAGSVLSQRPTLPGGEDNSLLTSVLKPCSECR